MERKLEKITEIIGNSHNKADGILVTDKDGYIEYFRPCEGLSDVALSEIEGYYSNNIGKHVLELYPELTEETSTVMEVLRTGETVVNRYQKVSFAGKYFVLTGKTIPIVEDGEVKGAIDIEKIVIMQKRGGSESDVQQLYTIDDIITADDRFLKIKEHIKDVARSRSPVLIYGETGTGKELVAEAIHREGDRKNGPFISQNCASIPENLVESIFFGTEKGSFTGAENKPGIFELANGGTLFLDEINSMNKETQAKLLKALEENKIRRLGGTKEIGFDIRLICATNEKIDNMLKSNRLRKDLYYRIAVVKLDIPPLRERPGDVMLLSNYYIDLFNKRMGKKIRGISEVAMEAMLEYDWPGNARELRNIIESAFNVEKNDVISLNSLYGFIEKVKGEASVNDKRSLEKELNLDRIAENYIEMNSGNIEHFLLRVEKNIIEKMLLKEGKINAVALKLGMSPQKLQYRMKKLGIKRKIF